MNPQPSPVLRLTEADIAAAARLLDNSYGISVLTCSHEPGADSADLIACDRDVLVAVSLILCPDDDPRLTLHGKRETATRLLAQAGAYRAATEPPYSGTRADQLIVYTEPATGQAYDYDYDQGIG